MLPKYKILQNFLKSGGRSYPYKKYNDVNRVIFIHIPKSAGSSMLDAIGAPKDGRLHIDYFQYMRSNSMKFDNYTKFSVVREPLDRLFSCYRYFLSGGNQSEADLVMKQVVEGAGSSFDEFVDKIVTPSMMSQWNMLRPQCSYICSKSGELMMDRVLKYETLDRDYQELRDILPWLPERLKKINVSKRSVDIPASSSTVSRVQNLYDLDYKYFYK